MVVRSFSAIVFLLGFSELSLAQNSFEKQDTTVRERDPDNLAFTTENSQRQPLSVEAYQNQRASDVSKLMTAERNKLETAFPAK